MLNAHVSILFGPNVPLHLRAQVTHATKAFLEKKNVFFFFSANCIVMALDEHLPNGDKTILALQLVSKV